MVGIPQIFKRLSVPKSFVPKLMISWHVGDEILKRPCRMLLLQCSFAGVVFGMKSAPMELLVVQELPQPGGTCSYGPDWDTCRGKGGRGKPRPLSPAGLLSQCPAPCQKPKVRSKGQAVTKQPFGQGLMQTQPALSSRSSAQTSTWDEIQLSAESTRILRC